MNEDRPQGLDRLLHRVIDYYCRETRQAFLNMNAANRAVERALKGAALGGHPQESNLPPDKVALHRGVVFGLFGSTIERDRSIEQIRKEMRRELEELGRGTEKP